MSFTRVLALVSDRFEQWLSSFIASSNLRGRGWRGKLLEALCADIFCRSPQERKDRQTDREFV